MQTNPNYAEALINKGNTLGKLGRYNEAIIFHDKALQINPNYAEAFYDRGVDLYNLGRYNESITYFDKALQIDPTRISKKMAVVFSEYS
ncbi:MAG: tetratricopeptide repeat protein [Thermoproteota archaeon]|nr:tetratricopeptide repeat protein [Thermoproteota archaeon]